MVTQALMMPNRTKEEKHYKDSLGTSQPTEGQAPPGSILFGVPLVFMLQKKRKTRKGRRKAPAPEREFSLFDGPGRAMGIGFFFGRWGLLFARKRDFCLVFHDAGTVGFACVVIPFHLHLACRTTNE